MSVKISNFNQDIVTACLILLFASSSSHAEIYKWVDANGRTHYSERKEDAGKAKAVELNAGSDTQAPQTADSPSQYWQEQEIKFRQRQVQKSNVPPATPTKPKSLSGGRSDGSNASRCNLARDVISGAVRHSNGAPTDKYDREIAENDIRAYCQ